MKNQILDLTLASILTVAITWSFVALFSELAGVEQAVYLAIR